MSRGILSRGILSRGFCPGSFVRRDFVLEPGQPNKRFMNIENHVFGHSTSFISGFFLRKSLKMVMPIINGLLTRLLARSILGSTWPSQAWAIRKNETLYFLAWSE